MSIILHTLVNTPSSIFYLLPEGKPNNKLPRDTGPDRRERLPLLEDPTKERCYQRAIDCLRRPIGKEPCEELREERRIEEVCSKRTKAFKSAFALYPNDMFRFSDSILEAISQEQVSSLVNDPTTPENLRLIYRKFVDQTKFSNFFDFMFDEKYGRLQKADSEFLDYFGVNIKENYIEALVQREVYTVLIPVLKLHARNPSMSISAWFEEIKREPQFKSTVQMIRDKYTREADRLWKKLGSVQRHHLIRNLTSSVSAEKFGLEKVQYRPDRNIDKLINELKEKGPMLFIGYFGSGAYQDECKKVSNTLSIERDVYGWPVGATRKKMPGGHAIVVIGAEEVSLKGSLKQYVYYIDPSEASSDSQVRRIYKISLKNFQENMYDLQNSLFFNPEENVIPDGFYYGYSSPFFIRE